ncbi:UNVERIFIED_CONTAM: hypothetical protein FKN15_054706 [Acipenser sinensis]
MQERALRGHGYSSVMLEDFRRIVKEVLRDEIATLWTEIQQAIAVIQATLSECTEKIQDVEDSMNAFEIRLAGTESTCSLLSCENNKLGAQIDDLENRSRRNNLRVFRVPEGMEEGNRVYVPLLHRIVWAEWPGLPTCTGAHTPLASSETETAQVLSF